MGDPTTVLTFFLVSRLGRRNDSVLESISRAHGITAAELNALAVLHMHENGLKVSFLGQLVLQTSGGVTKTVNRLAAAGLVRKRSDPTDGRARRVVITAAGKRTALRCLDDALSVYDEVLGRLGSRSDRVLHALADLVDATELTADARDSATL